MCDIMYAIDIGSFRGTFEPRTSFVLPQCHCTADGQNVYSSDPFIAFSHHWKVGSVSQPVS